MRGGQQPLDEDRIKGTAINIGGKVKDAAGRLLSDSKTQADGKADQASGQQAADQVEQKAQQAAEATRKGLASASLFGFVALALGAVASWFGGTAGAPRRKTKVVRTGSTI